MSQTPKSASAFGMNPNDALNDLRMSEKAMPLYEHVKRFIAETVEPMSVKYAKLGENRVGEERWQYAPGQLELLNAAKDQAKKEGLWNFFLPDAETGEGLSNLDYAFIASELGKNPLGSESMNCSAPDTGNMEVLSAWAPEQAERRSGAAAQRTVRSRDDRVHHASSDAKNIATTAARRRRMVINGEALHLRRQPALQILITMVRTSPDAPHKQQSMILPKDTPGVADPGAMTVFAEDHARRTATCTSCSTTRAQVQHAAGRRSRLRDQPGAARAGAHPPLHALDRRGREGAGPDGRARPVAPGLRQAAGLAGRQRRDHLARAHRHRGHAPDGAEGGQGDGRAGQPRGRIWIHMVRPWSRRVCDIIGQAIQMAVSACRSTRLWPTSGPRPAPADRRRTRRVHHMVVGRHNSSNTAKLVDPSLVSVFRS